MKSLLKKQELVPVGIESNAEGATIPMANICEHTVKPSLLMADIEPKQSSYEFVWKCGSDA